MALLVKLLIFLSSVALSSCSTGAPRTSCSALKTLFKDQGLQESVVPSSLTLGNGLKVCPRINQTCCTSKVEQNFKGLGKKDFNSALSSKLGANNLFFETQGRMFGATFRNLIRKSKTDLNKMFVRTYGVLYENNAKIFLDLYDEFDKYFRGSNLDLNKVMDQFFRNLLRKMFQLLNPQSKFNAKYLDCVTDSIDSLKPFGDVPKELSNQIKKSFVAARALVSGLGVGHNVLSEMQRVSSSESCQVGIVKMKYCSLCSEDKLVKPCPVRCRNVFKSCFLGWESLSPHWDNYIIALEELTDKLGGPFSFEAVIDPIDVKISDAIMNMQEGKDAIKKKVLAGCGYPKTKRSVPDSVDFFIESPKRRNKRNAGKTKSKAKSSQPTSAEVTLESLITDFKTKVRETKGMWRTMVGSVCSTFAASAKEECWNGTAKIIPTIGAAPPKIVLSNDASKNQIPALVKRQISQLKLAIQKLKSAKNGDDVFIKVDGEDEDSGSAASASGSGSGDNVMPTDNSRTLSPTDGNSVDVLDSGLSKDVLDTRSLGVPLQPPVWLVVSCLCVLLKVITL